MTAAPLCCACLHGCVGPCMASVSVGVSRWVAAGRRWGAGACFALQICLVHGTRHQTKRRAGPLRTALERFAPTAPTAEIRVGAREAPVYAVPPLPPLPPVRMSGPRGLNTPAVQVYPPLRQGTSAPFCPTGATGPRERVSACNFQ